MNRTSLFSALISIFLVFTQLAQAEGGNAEARLQQRNNQALLEAAKEGDAREVKYLLEEGADPDHVSNYGWNAITLVSRYSGNVEIMELLKQGGADIYATTSGGWSAVHLGARYGSNYAPGFYRFLLDNNYPLDVPIPVRGANLGLTPLMLTAYGNNTRFAKMLIENNVDPGRKREGKTAADYARQQNKPAVLAVLQKAATEQKNLREKKARDQEIAERKARRLERDSKLPLSVRKDKYMIALTENLKAENYRESLSYFELLAEMQVELPASFYYFWGEALFKTGQPEASLDKLYAYIGVAGADGEYYRQALSLSNKAEDSL